MIWIPLLFGIASSLILSGCSKEEAPEKKKDKPPLKTKTEPQAEISSSVNIHELLPETQSYLAGENPEGRNLDTNGDGALSYFELEPHRQYHDLTISPRVWYDLAYRMPYPLGPSLESFNPQLREYVKKAGMDLNHDWHLTSNELHQYVSQYVSHQSELTDPTQQSSVPPAIREGLSHFFATSLGSHGACASLEKMIRVTSFIQQKPPPRLVAFWMMAYLHGVARFTKPASFLPVLKELRGLRQVVMSDRARPYFSSEREGRIIEDWLSLLESANTRSEGVEPSCGSMGPFAMDVQRPDFPSISPPSLEAVEELLNKMGINASHVGGANLAPVYLYVPESKRPKKLYVIVMEDHGDMQGSAKNIDLLLRLSQNGLSEYYEEQSPFFQQKLLEVFHKIAPLKIHRKQLRQKVRSKEPLTLSLDEINLIGEDYTEAIKKKMSVAEYQDYFRGDSALPLPQWVSPELETATVLPYLATAMDVPFIGAIDNEEMRALSVHPLLGLTMLDRSRPSWSLNQVAHSQQARSLFLST